LTAPSQKIRPNTKPLACALGRVRLTWSWQGARSFCR
jgi:hypothetical protein